MNATMIKGERSKLLAVAVVFAMVACALVAFVPSSDAADGPLEAADSYTYEDYEYKGERTVVGNDVIIVYPMAYDATMLVGMNDDFPRFIGALHRADDGATVSSITYDGVVYNWDDTGILKGSNWEDASGRTLADAVGDDLGSNPDALAELVSTGGSVPLILTLNDDSTIEMNYIVSAPVASIEGTYYGTLQAAADAVDDGQTITLNKDAADESNVILGGGVFIGPGKFTNGITIDFNGCTYNVDRDPVGSPDTENQAFHIEQNNKVTLKNGTITSTPGSGVKMLVQNYCDLTMDDLVVDASNNPQVTYASSNNCGDVTISGSTNIVASAGNVAFDVCGYASYTGVSVTIADDFTGTIDGKVEVTRSAGNSNPVDFNINANVSIDTIDIQTGNVAIAENVTVTAETVTVGSDATLDNNGKLDATDYENNGIETVVENGVEIAIVGSVDAFRSATEKGAFSNVRLGADIVINNTDWVYSGTTIDLAGYDLTYNKNLGVESGAYIEVPAGSTLHITNIVFRVGEIPADGWLKTEGAILDATGKYIETPASVIEFAKAYNSTFIRSATGEESGPQSLAYTLVVTPETTLRINDADYRAYYTTNTTTRTQVLIGVALNQFHYNGPDALRLDDVTANGYDVQVFTEGYSTPVYSQNLEKDNISDVGVYEDALLINGSVSAGPNQGSAPIAIYVDIVVLPVPPTVVVDDITWVYGQYDAETDVPNIKYNGGAVPEDVKITWEILDNGKVVTDYNSLAVGEYTLRVHYTAAGNYAAGYVDAKATVTYAKQNIDIGSYEENFELTIGEDKYGHIYDYLDGFTVEKTERTETYPYDYKLDGTVLYVIDNPAFNNQAPGDRDGYYLVLKLTNNGVEAKYKVTINGVENTKENTLPGMTEGVPGTDWLMIWVDDLAQLNSLSITFTADSYEPLNYDLDVSALKRNTVAGYAAEETAAEKQMMDNGVLTDAEKDNVGAMTMWIAFDAMGAVTGQAYLYYDGSNTPIYSQEMKDPAPTGRWFFSFDPTNGSYIGLSSTINPCLEAFDAYKTASGNAAPGEYTMEIVLYNADGEEIATVSDNAYIEGEVNSGFEYFADAAEAGIIARNPGFNMTDVDDKTLWFTWYQSQDLTGITITVTKGGSEVTYTEPAQGGYSLDAGLHTFYASFNNQLSEFADDPLGTYTITVKAGDKVIASGDVVVDDVPTQFDITDLAEEYLGKAPQEYMDVTINGLADSKFTISGEVFYIDAWDAYWTGAETAGYYIGIVITDAEGNPIDSKYWANATGFINNPNNTLLTEQPKEFAAGTMDGTFVLYLGDVEELTALKDITVSIDLDGEGEFLTATEYTLDLNLTEGTHTYSATYIDEPYGYGVSITYEDKYAVLPNLPDVSKDAYGWYVKGTEGTIYTAGTLVDLSQIDVDTDYEIEFVATYVTDVRDQYAVSIDSVDTENGQLVIKVESSQVSDVAGGVVYRNLTANHYYVISVTEENGSGYERIVASNAITNGGFGSAETLTVSGLTLAEGDLVTVYFYADYVENYPAFGSDSYAVPTEASGPVVGFDADADSVEQAIADAYEELGYTEVPELTAVENTAFVVFETGEEYNDVHLIAYVIPQGGNPEDAVYTEDFTFTAAGAHVFYFTFTGVNSNTDAGVGGVIAADVTVGETYDIMIVTQEGTLVFSASVTYQTAQTA